MQELQWQEWPRALDPKQKQLVQQWEEKAWVALAVVATTIFP
jgi:hypothetical protein